MSPSSEPIAETNASSRLDVPVFARRSSGVPLNTTRPRDIVAAAALAVDLVVPDIVPFVDEVLLAAGAAGLAMLRKRREEKTSPGEAEPADETTTG